MRTTLAFLLLASVANAQARDGLSYDIPQFDVTEGIYTAPRTPKVNVSVFDPEGIVGAKFTIGDSAAQQTALKANLLKHLAKSKETKAWKIKSWKRVSVSLIEVRLSDGTEPAAEAAKGKYPQRPSSASAKSKPPAPVAPPKAESARPVSLDDLRKK